MDNIEKLPEKWCIKKTNDTYQIINNWLNEGVSRPGYYRDEDGYIHYPNTSNFKGFKADCHSYTFIKPSYVEITFEQFKKYVLEEETVSEINNDYQIF